MARLKTAQPNHSLHKIAVVVATAVSGMSVYAQAAVEPKEETITVTAAPAPQESAWGPAATIAAKHSATVTKTDTPIEKTPQSISVVTRQEMEMKQPTTVKEALAYTPGVFCVSSHRYCNCLRTLKEGLPDVDAAYRCRLFWVLPSNCLCDETLSYARDCEVKNEGSELLG